MKTTDELIHSIIAAAKAVAHQEEYYYKGMSNYGYGKADPETLEKLEEACSAMRQRVQELEEERLWIPVRARLPEEGQDVYVVTDCNEIDAWRYDAHLRNLFTQKYTHWIPWKNLLPPPEASDEV